MEELEAIYTAILERWNFIVNLGGEWNGGYAAALKFALDLVSDQQLKLSRANAKLNTDDYHHLKSYPKKDWSKYYGHNKEAI
jgi:hypothetical protein